jgi:hypothetical protein
VQGNHKPEKEEAMGLSSTSAEGREDYKKKRKIQNVNEFLQVQLNTQDKMSIWYLGVVRLLKLEQELPGEDAVENVSKKMHRLLDFVPVHKHEESKILVKEERYKKKSLVQTYSGQNRSSPDWRFNWNFRKSIRFELLENFFNCHDRRPNWQL